MIVAFYARVSSDEQREQATVRSQLDYARRRAEAEGWTLVEFVDDGVSGLRTRLGERAGGAALLQAARSREVDLVVSYKLDRIARRATYILEALEAFTAARVPYRSLTEPWDTSNPALATFLITLLAANAELEVANLVARTRAGIHRSVRTTDRWPGGTVPYAYRKREDKAIEPDERPIPGKNVSEAEVVREIFRMAAEGIGLRSIVKALNERGMPCSHDRGERDVERPDGKRRRRLASRWYYQAVRRIVFAPVYAGRAVYRIGVGRGRKLPASESLLRPVPAIVSPALYERAHAAIQSHARWGSPHAGREYPLRGVLRCGSCARVLIGDHYKTKAGEIRQYRCENHPRGETVYVRADAVEAVLWRDVVEVFEHPSAALRVLARGASEAGDAEGRAEAELLALATELRELEERERTLLDAHLRELFSPKVLARKAEEIRNARLRLEREMDRVRQDRAAAAKAGEETEVVRRMLARLAERARSADLRTQGEVLRELVREARVERLEGRQVRVRVRYVVAPSGFPATYQSTSSTRRRGARARAGAPRSVA